MCERNPWCGGKCPPFHFVNLASTLLPTFNCCKVFNLMPVSSLVGVLLIRCGTVKSPVKSCFIDRASGKKSNPVKFCFVERESEMGGNVILVIGRGREGMFWIKRVAMLIAGIRQGYAGDGSSPWWPLYTTLHCQ